MKVVLDRGLCQGHGRCYDLAPTLFAPDEEGYAVLLVDGELAEHDEAAARLAAANCPEFAIRLE